jgi:hypothetical protein
MAGDIEVSLHELHIHPGAYEVNPLLGHYPSRARYYAVELPLTGLAIWSSWHYKRQSDALRGSGYPDHKYMKWHILNDVLTGLHGIDTIVSIKR